MLKGFRDFILRGNVVDLAVAVVVGAAFTGVVTALSNQVIKPLVAAVGGNTAIGFGIQLGAEGNTPTFVDLGALITSLINFLIVAAVVYFLVVLPTNRLLRLRQRHAEPEVQATPEDIALLAEIRDLLREQSNRR